MFNIPLTLKAIFWKAHQTFNLFFWCTSFQLLITGNQRRYSSRLSIPMFIGHCKLVMIRMNLCYVGKC